MNYRKENYIAAVPNRDSIEEPTIIAMMTETSRVRNMIRDVPMVAAKKEGCIRPRISLRRTTR